MIDSDFHLEICFARISKGIPRDFKIYEILWDERRGGKTWACVGASHEEKVILWILPAFAASEVNLFLYSPKCVLKPGADLAK